MADLTHVKIEEFGPGADEYPEHDHSEAGIGGEMFAQRREVSLLAIGGTPGEAYDSGGTL